MASEALDIPLVVTDDDKIPESRVRDGAHANSIFRKLQLDDRDAELKRANIDYLIDGGLPYSEAAMEDAGRGEDANVNFMEGKAEDDMAQAPFINMTTVSATLWNLKTSHGTVEEQSRYGKIISEKFTRTVREWGGDFDFYRQRLTQQYTRHGVGFQYWEDELDWRWRSDGLSVFKLPRDTESRASAIPYCICKRSMTVTELYAFIRNEKRAKEVGRWNIEAVKRALVRAAFTTSRPWQNDEWEEFQKEVRENDVEYGSRAGKVKVFHLWMKEYDGQISHYIGLQDGVAMESGEVLARDDIERSNGKVVVGNGFLYAHRNRFKSWESCLIPYFYSIGTHGTIHSIRGQGEMNFGPVSIENRAMCKMIDCAGASTSIVLEAETEADAEKAAWIQQGPFLIKSGNAKLVPTAMPDVSERLLPMFDQLRQLRRRISPTEQPADQSQSRQPETKYKTQSDQLGGSMLSTVALTQFFGPWGRGGKEMFLRMMNPKLQENDPGGKEAFEFRIACMNEGVPPEALRAVYSVEAVRAIGNGSPQVRQYAAEQVWQLSGSMDQVGRHQAMLDLLASIPGMDYQTAGFYAGPLEPRKTQDDTDATLENALFMLGRKVPVVDGQDNWVHCGVHASMVQEIVQSFQQQQLPGAQLVPILSAALDNMLEHSQLLDKDQTRQKEAASVRKFIQNQNGTLEQQQNKLFAEQQRQSEDAQQQGQPNPEEQRKSELHQEKLNQMRQEFELHQAEVRQKLQIADQDARAKRSLADLKASSEIAKQNAKLAAYGP